MTKNEQKKPFSVSYRYTANPKAAKRAKSFYLGKDGVDHINVMYNGETELGRALSTTIELFFIHPGYGEFNSIEGLIYFLKEGGENDAYRTMRGSGPRKTYEAFLERTQQKDQVIPNFQALVLDAIWQRAKQYKTLFNDLKTSTLHFESYYHVDNTNHNTGCIQTDKIPTNWSNWLCPGIGELRKAAKEGREPDLSRWKLVNKDSALYFPEKKFIDMIDGGTEEQYRERAKSLKRKKKASKVETEDQGNEPIKELDKEAIRELEEMSDGIKDGKLHFTNILAIVEDPDKVEDAEQTTEVNEVQVVEELVNESPVAEEQPEGVVTNDEKTSQVNSEYSVTTEEHITGTQE